LIFKILLTLNNKRRSPIVSEYRPDWIGDNKPEYNGARVLFTNDEILPPGERCQCILEPFAQEFWDKVVVGDTLKCMEGPTEVGEAVVLEIMAEKPKVLN
jgi:hypothetical protein